VSLVRYDVGQVKSPLDVRRNELYTRLEKSGMQPEDQLWDVGAPYPL